MAYDGMFEKLKDDSIKNEELACALRSKKWNVAGLAVYTVIQRRYCDESIIRELVLLASILDGYKVIGPYQMGHLATAALYLVQAPAALDCFNQRYDCLDEIDKFLVDNFIEQYERAQCEG